MDSEPGPNAPSSDPDLPTPAAGPTTDDVVGALRALLDSSAFAGSRRSRDFLAYVVTETLAGRAGRLSERTVGRRALGRPDAFDGRADSSVRVRASRVRDALERYYASEGRRDPVRISLPTGGYVPAFDWRDGDGDGEPAQPLQPGLVLVEFAGNGGDRARLTAHAVTETLAQRLTAFPGIRVLGPLTTHADDPRAIGRVLDARYVLRGAITAQDAAVRLSARLADAATGETIWAVTETQASEEFTGFSVEDAWATSIAAEIGDYSGVVVRHELGSGPGRETAPAHAAALAFYAFIETGTKDALLRAAAAADRALDEGMRPAALLAMRGSLFAVGAGYELSDDVEADLRAAEALAREALASDPHNALAHYVLATVAVVRTQWDEVRRHVDDALALNPYHPTYLLTAAALLARAGDWERSQALAEEAFRLNPRQPGYTHTITALARLLVDDDAGALAEASLIHAPGQLWGPLYRAMALAGLGHLEQARTEVQAALELEPTLLSHPERLFTNAINLSADQVAVLARHLEPLRDQPRT